MKVNLTPHNLFEWFKRNVSDGCYTEKDMDNAYDKGVEDSSKVKSNTMKEQIKLTEEQIIDGENAAYLKAGYNAYFGNGFNAGVEFALKQVNKDILLINKIMGLKDKNFHENNRRLTMISTGNGDYVLQIWSKDKNGLNLCTPFEISMSGGYAPSSVKIATAKLFNELEEHGFNKLELE